MGICSIARSARLSQDAGHLPCFLASGTLAAAHFTLMVIKPWPLRPLPEEALVQHWLIRRVCHTYTLVRWDLWRLGFLQWLLGGDTTRKCKRVKALVGGLLSRKRRGEGGKQPLVCLRVLLPWSFKMQWFHMAFLEASCETKQWSVLVAKLWPA